MNLLHFPRLWLAAGLFMIVTIGAQAQSAANPRETALRFLQENPAQFNLSKADVSDVRVTDEYLSKHNGITHVWVQQQHQGIPVFNGLFGLHVKPDGSVLTVGHRFVRDLASKINTTIPSLSASKAVEMAFINLGFTGFPAPSLRQKINDRNFIFEGGAVSTRDIAVSACYELQREGSVRLAWTLVIAQANTSDIWTLRVDAQTGAILSKYNRTVSCETGRVHRPGEACSDETPVPVPDSKIQNSAFTAAESYNVFALPTESPSFGARQIVVNPADPAASPFGWHDINGAAGAEYTYTRGNNVYAFDDRDDNNQPPATPFPNAGASLSFNYPFNPDAEPLDNLNAAITNLFYMNNMMHDITYRYGFDEVAGNFQTNNYGNGGAGDDAVQANAIDSYSASPQKVNDANFSTDPDGYDARMQMFVWPRGGQSLTVNSSAPVAGVYTTSGTQNWGADITDVPVTGEVVLTDDGIGTSLGCVPPVNSLTGKIAMVYRENCQFGVKALNMQNAGAIGCIICNTEPGYVIMAAGTSGDEVNIPVVMLSYSDCEVLRQYVAGGLNVSFVLPPSSGPNLLDGDFDNGIIAHEYGHGISNRLTGGPANTECLFNGEQMGEGWSDFFTLITTLKPGDVAATPRGIGTYVLRHPTDGAGIRRYPYTTDMTINPLTYESVAENTEVHARGEVWAAVTWDLYWAMVEKYGFDADITNVNSGNGRAIQLVMDGMKLQPCDPGFIDGRNGILAADKANYGGADTCLISSVFARRGLGYYADQASRYNASDGVENFDPIPACIKELKIKKETTTPLIEPGANAGFVITVTNHKNETAPNVVVTDELPAGLSFISASNGGIYANGFVTWNLGNMPAAGKVTTITYTAKSLDGIGSSRYYQDMMDTDNDWISYNLDPQVQEYFTLQNSVVKSGTAAWQAESLPTELDMTLEPINNSIFTVSGNQPVLRFWHQYNTETRIDAGILEIQQTGEQLWHSIPADKSFRNPYTGKVGYSTFAKSNVSGFSGNSNGWVQSWFDLSDYAGQTIKIRFRLGTNEDDLDNPLPAGSWYVDEIEAMDMYNFDTEVCVTSGGDHACDKAPDRGVIVQPGLVGTEEPDAANQLSMQVQPNPASDFLYLSLDRALSGPIQVQLTGADGRMVLSKTLDGIAEGQIVTLDVLQVPAGVYMVRLESAAGSSVKKVVIR